MTKSCIGCGDRVVRFKCRVCENLYLCTLCFNDSFENDYHNPEDHHINPLPSSHDFDDENIDEEDEVDDEDEEEEDMDNQNYNEDDDDEEDRSDSDGQLDLQDLDEIDATFSKLFQNLAASVGTKTYKCPFCPSNSTHTFTESTLPDHVITSHRYESKLVVCPICASKPGGDPNYLSRNLVGHMGLRHKNINNNNEELNSKTDFLASLFGVSSESLSSILKQKDILKEHRLTIEQQLKSTLSSSSSSSTSTTTNNILGNKIVGSNKSNNQLYNQQQEDLKFESFLFGNKIDQNSNIKSTSTSTISQSPIKSALISPTQITKSDLPIHSLNNIKTTTTTTTTNPTNTINTNTTLTNVQKIQKPKYNQLIEPLTEEEYQDKLKQNILKSVFVQDLIFSSIFN